MMEPQEGGGSLQQEWESVKDKKAPAKAAPKAAPKAGSLASEWEALKASQASPADPFASAPSPAAFGGGGAASAGVPRPAPMASPSMQGGGAPPSLSATEADIRTPIAIPELDRFGVAVENPKIAAQVQNVQREMGLDPQALAVKSSQQRAASEKERVAKAATEGIAKIAALPKDASEWVDPPPQEGALPTIDPRWERVMGEYRAEGTQQFTPAEIAARREAGTWGQREDARERMKAFGLQQSKINERSRLLSEAHRSLTQSRDIEAESASLQKEGESLEQERIALEQGGATQQQADAYNQKLSSYQQRQQAFVNTIRPIEEEGAYLDAWQRYVTQGITNAEALKALDPRERELLARQIEADANEGGGYAGTAHRFFKRLGGNVAGLGLRTLNFVGNIPNRAAGKEDYYSPFAYLADEVDEQLERIEADKPTSHKTDVFSDQWKVNPGFLHKMLDGALYAGTLSAAGATGGVRSMSALGMAGSSEDYYREGIESGLKPKDSEIVSLLLSGTEASIEALNLGPFVNSGARKSIMRGAVDAIKKGAAPRLAAKESFARYMAEQMGAEAGEEVLTSVAQSMVKKGAEMATGVDQDTELTLQGLAGDAVMGAAIGGLMGGVGRLSQRPLYKEGVAWAVQNSAEFRQYVAQNIPEAEQGPILERFEVYEKVYRGLPSDMKDDAKMTVAHAVAEKERLKKEKGSAIVDDVVSAMTGNRFDAQIKEQDEIIAEASGTTLADVIKKQEIAKLQDQYDKAKLKSEVTGKPMPEGSVRPKDAEAPTPPPVEEAATPVEDAIPIVETEGVPVLAEARGGEEVRAPREEPSAEAPPVSEEGQVASPGATPSPTSPVRREGEIKQPEQPKKKEDGIEQSDEGVQSGLRAGSNKRGDAIPEVKKSPPPPAQAPPRVPVEDAGEVAKSKEAVSEEGVKEEVPIKDLPRPPFRDWRISKTYHGSVTIVPNKVGGKFTDEQIDALGEWAKENGLIVHGRGPTKLNVHTRGSRSMNDFGVHGAAGVASETAAAKKAATKKAEADRDVEEREYLDKSPAWSWAKGVFGEDAMNTYNAIKLADFLDGKDKKFGGLVGRSWIDGLEKLDALPADGQPVDFQKIKDAYSTAQKEEATPTPKAPEGEKKTPPKKPIAPKEAVSEEGVSKEVKSVTEGMGIDWNDSANLTDALDDLKHDWGKDIASVEAGKEPVLSVADVTEAKKAIADIEARIKELAPAAPLKAPKKNAPKKEVSAATDERKPAKKQEEPPKTPTGWKREGQKSVEKPTAITDEKNKTIVAYSIPGFEDIPIVSVKAPGGWRPAIKIGDTTMVLGSADSGEGMPSFAAARAWRILEKHGREKVEAMVEKSIKAQEAAKGTGVSEQRPMLPPTITIDGKERSTTNSKGQPIALTEEGVRNFYAWFGESEVVDEEGRPLVVYHGTPQDFDAFETEMRGYRHGTTAAKKAFFFTTSAEAAFNFSGYHGSLMPVFISARSVSRSDFTEIAPWDDKTGHRKRNEVVQRAVRTGKDGVIFENMADFGPRATVVAVFDPAQIKSATGNSGAFDPKNPNITQQRPTDSTPIKTGRPRLDRVLNAMKDMAPGLNIIVHETKAAYSEAVAKEGQGLDSSWGVYAPSSNTIHVSPASPDLKQTLFHETAHPIILALARNNPDRIVDFVHEVRNHPDGKRYQRFASRYRDLSVEAQMNEVLAEFMGDVASGKVPVSTKPDSLWQRFKAFIQDILAALGWDMRSIDLSKPDNVREFAAQFKKAMDKGIRITGLTPVDVSGISMQRPKTTKASEWNAAVDAATDLNNLLSNGEEKSILDAADLITDPDGKAEFIRLMNEQMDVTATEKAEATESTEEPKRVKKTITTKRAYEGEFRDEVKKELEKIGLYRSVENREEARGKAAAFVAKVGADAALDAVRNGDVRGAEATYVFKEAISDIQERIANETDAEALAELYAQEAALVNELNDEGTAMGRFIGALGSIYEEDDLGFRSEVKASEWRKQFGEEPSAELMEKWKQRDKEFAELEKKLKDAEERAAKAEEQAAVEAIKESIARERRKPRTYTQKSKDLADRFRKLKTQPMVFKDANGNVIEVKEMGFNWNELVEVGAKAIEKTGQLADGIAAIAEKLKASGFFANMSDKDREAVMQQIEERFRAINEEDTDGRIRIPKQMIREAVIAGAEDIDTLVDVIMEQVKDEYPDATKREIRDAITEYGKVVNMSQDEISAKIRRMKDIGRTISAIEDVENRIRPLRSGLQRDKLDAEQRALKKKLREMMKELPIDEQTQLRELRTALDAAKSRTRNRIEDMEREIEMRERIRRSNKVVEPDAELQALIQRKEELQKEHDEIFKDKSITEEERLQRAVDSARRSLDDVQRKIREMDIEPKKPTPLNETPELRALRDELGRAREEFRRLQEEAGIMEKRRLDAAKKMAAARIDDYRRRLEERDFSKKEKKAAVSDTELERLRAEKIRLKEEYDKEFYKESLRHRTVGQWIKDFIWEAWGFARAVKATSEISFVLIQGGTLTVSNLYHRPSVVASAFRNMWDAMKSEKKSEDWLRKIKAQDWYPVAKEAKLAITEPHAELSAREELFVSDWTRIFWDIIGSPLLLKSKSAHERWSKANPFRALERGAVSYLDTLRVERFLGGMAVLDKKKAAGEEITKQDYKDIADAINTLTGRASLGKNLDPMAKTLTKVFFSPRLWASGIKTATPYALWYFGKMRPTARKLALQDLGRMVGTTMGIVALAAAYLNNDDDDDTGVEMDPLSSDFGKIKLGEIRVDPWSGRIQQVVLTSRLTMGGLSLLMDKPLDAYKDKHGQLMPLGSGSAPTMGTVLARMATNKLSPAASMLVEAMGTRVNKDGTRSSYGKEYSIDDKMIEAATPIYFETISELVKEDPGALEGFLIFYAFFGGGVSIQEPSKKKSSSSSIPTRGR